MSDNTRKERWTGWLGREGPIVTEGELDAFLGACGAAGPLRLEVERPGEEPPALPEYPQPFVIIGRDERSDLMLDHEEVSRRHAYFQWVGDRLFAVDLQSRTGTHWHEGPLSMNWIAPGDAVTIGPYRVGAAGPVVGHGDNAPPLPTSQDFEQPGLVEANLEVLDPTITKATWRINRMIVLLGRVRPCWVRLPSRDVSRIHCSLMRTPAGVWVVDLLSREGILVNDQPVRCARLDEGDEIQIGPHRVRLRMRSSGTTIAPVAPWSPAVPARPSLPTTPMLNSAHQVLATRPAPDSTDSMLMTVLGEMGQMQQQMAEQFQQALMMMFQLFSNMHNEQMTLIREELAQIQRLTQEQQSLQAELARHVREQAAPEPAAKAAPRATLGPAPPTLRLVTGHAPKTKAVPTPRPLPTRPTPDQAPTPTPASATPPAESPTRPPTPTPASATPPPRKAPAAQSDIHDLLTRRLAAIQEERQGRWQKLIKAVTGGRAPTGAP